MNGDEFRWRSIYVSRKYADADKDMMLRWRARRRLV